MSLDDLNENLWKRYHGIATHLIDDSDPKGTLKILCPELNPFFSEKLIHKDDDVNFAAEDVWKTRSSSNVKTKNTIEAIYLGGVYNVSIPDIHLGEQVEVLQYGNTDTYYWRQFRKDEFLRLREHYKIRCADTPTRIKYLDDDNTYFFEINTKIGSKQITLSTSKSDSESYRYLIKIDPDKNTILINDDIGNFIRLESDNHRIILQNTDATKVSLDRQNLYLYARDSIILDAGNRISTKSPLLLMNHNQGIVRIITLLFINCSMTTVCG